MLYLGHAYHGLAAAVAHMPSTPSSSDGKGPEAPSNQPDAIPTIEGELFKALDNTRLLPPGGRAASNFSRCGRTDAGVSALGQVIAIKLRSKARVGEAIPPMHEELDYVRMLNAVLPVDVRVTGWCPVEEEFSARFCAGYRVYRYYFPKRGMNIAHMQEAAKHLVGTHDFRNFCKPDVLKVTTFERSILSFGVLPCSPVGTDFSLHSTSSSADAAPPTLSASALPDRHSMWYFEIVGQAFLWHQVRCMAAVLFRVGRGVESPDITRCLLDIQRVPQKPQFGMAHQEALCLYFCHFHDLPLWASPHALKALMASVEGVWSQAAVRTAMLSDMLTSLFRLPVLSTPSADTASHLVSVYEADLAQYNQEHGITITPKAASGAGSYTIPQRSEAELHRLSAAVQRSRDAPARGTALGAPCTLEHAKPIPSENADDLAFMSSASELYVVLGAAATTVPRVALPASLLPGTAAAGRFLESQHNDVARSPPSLAAVVNCLHDPPLHHTGGGGSGVAPAVVASTDIAAGQARAALAAAINAVQAAAHGGHITSVQQLLEVAAALPGGGKGGPARVTAVAGLAPSPAPDSEVDTECPLKTRNYTPLLHPSHKREPSIQERLQRRGLSALPSKAAVLQAGGTQGAAGK